MVCEHMEPQGFGALQLAFEQLKRRSHAEGLFDAARKRPLPALPRKIGMVTSLDGAALRDMIQLPAPALSERAPGDSRRLGCRARAPRPRSARGLARVARVPGVDVIIVGRGGGSLEDLWAFNEEVVARAIAASPVPVISAVGHETDVTIADFVADLRAPTPSAAAELVVARKDDFWLHIDRLGERLDAAMSTPVRRIESQAARASTARSPATAGCARAAGTCAAAHDLGAGFGAAPRRRRPSRGRAPPRALRRTLDQFDRGATWRIRGDLIAPMAGCAPRQPAAASPPPSAASATSGRPARQRSARSAVLGRGYAVTWNAGANADHPGCRARCEQGMKSASR